MVSSNQMLPLAASLLFASAANAQVALYGQCGGQGYSGSTSCVSGAVCHSVNAYYYQCIQGTATAATPTSSAAPAVQTTVVKEQATTLTPSVRASSTATSTVATVRATSAAASGTKYLMIFGDSYSSDGFWSGGNPPTAELPLGVSLPGTTSSGGLNWVGVTATQVNTSLTLAFDYAEYGATTDNTLVKGATRDLIAQVKEFHTYTAHDVSTVPWTEQNTMAIFWIGINDVGNKYWNNAATTIDQFLDKYFQQLQTLYDAGIRYFTLFTVPPFDKAPAFLQQSAAGLEGLRANITEYNNAIVSRLATFKSANSGVTGTVFNTSESFYTALNSPSTYGAKDATCTSSDGKSCLWYDTYHPGLEIHKLVASNFVKALKGTFF